MQTFAMIHDPLQFVRACRDLSAFGRGAYAEADTLLGLWLQPPRLTTLRLVPRPETDAPMMPELPGGPKILGSVGVSGLWTLSWLDGEWTRPALLDALVAASRPGRFGVPAGQFVPVYASDVGDEVMHHELAVLRRRHARHLSPPLWQSTTDGGLSLGGTPRVSLQQTGSD